LAKAQTAPMDRRRARQSEWPVAATHPGTVGAAL